VLAATLFNSNGLIAMDFSPMTGIAINQSSTAGLAVVVLVSIGWLWLTQFIQLMLMSEHDFPGRNDRFIWSMVFIFLCPLAPFAFWGWKSAFSRQIDAENELAMQRKTARATAIST
jgi:hypothetical protein